MNEAERKLATATAEFFKLHWNIASLDNPPEWKCWEEFLVGPVPNYQHGGCYALFAGSELIYVGLGASLGGGRYSQHGISRRLMAHVLRADDSNPQHTYRLLDNWTNTTAIWTLGLPKCEYLAPALESYLIRELSPPKNARV
ncbi:MAG: hypothetical protein FWG26_02510 [Betaproteobacteria bacterium]|jgi:hypothetical protein|nr:hypothetical protein [Betaproteobacteria bacterium]